MLKHVQSKHKITIHGNANTLNGELLWWKNYETDEALSAFAHKTQETDLFRMRGVTLLDLVVATRNDLNVKAQLLSKVIQCNKRVLKYIGSLEERILTVGECEKVYNQETDSLALELADILNGDSFVGLDLIQTSSQDSTKITFEDTKVVLSNSLLCNLHVHLENGVSYTFDSRQDDPNSFHTARELKYLVSLPDEFTPERDRVVRSAEITIHQYKSLFFGMMRASKPLKDLTCVFKNREEFMSAVDEYRKNYSVVISYSYRGDNNNNNEPNANSADRKKKEETKESNSLQTNKFYSEETLDGGNGQIGVYCTNNDNDLEIPLFGSPSKGLQIVREYEPKNMSLFSSLNSKNNSPFYSNPSMFSEKVWKIKTNYNEGDQAKFVAVVTSGEIYRASFQHGDALTFDLAIGNNEDLLTFNCLNTSSSSAI